MDNSVEEGGQMDEKQADRLEVNRGEAKEQEYEQEARICCYLDHEDGLMQECFPGLEYMSFLVSFVSSLALTFVENGDLPSEQENYDNL